VTAIALHGVLSGRLVRVGGFIVIYKSKIVFFKMYPPSTMLQKLDIPACNQCDQMVLKGGKQDQSIRHSFIWKGRGKGKYYHVSSV
jgi:hypothetical protein